MNAGYIKFVKKVTFKDREGAILKTYNVGDIVPFTHKDKNGVYITTMGGIYSDEAIEVENPAHEPESSFYSDRYGDW